MGLTGLKVIVTRPEGQADKLVSAIEKAGGIAYHYPVLTIKPLDSDKEPEQVQACKQLIMDLDNFQQVIFVSTNAVRFGMQWINNYWPQLPVAINWHAIGASTARELASAGVELSISTGSTDSTAMNSEALLQHSALQQLKGDKILIVRGVQGREFLKEQLTQRGARVSYAECYRRGLPDHTSQTLNALLRKSIDVICINSAESLDNLSLLAGEKQQLSLQHHRVLVPSQRVKALATQRGFKQVYLSENASDEAMIRGLQLLAGTISENHSGR
ncbi:MAG: uroporphyrinogen-III synthase [Spongiibacteraceae bacterium]|nr:uroporphyrinogen-III synthase [Spongiibacteraceae bacterium]